MNVLPAPLRTVRVLPGVLAALALLAATAAAASEPVTSAQFAPGWQSHAQPLFFMGPARDIRDKYRVPDLLPRGDYVLIRRLGQNGERAELIPGHRFTVDASLAERYVFLDFGGGEIDALPVADVPALAAQGR